MLHKHKKELSISLFAAGILACAAIGYFTILSFRDLVDDSYHAIFKIIVADRVLKEDARIISNIAYCNSDDSRQTLDLYLPHDPDNNPHALVVFIHGGAWDAGDKSTTLLSYYGEPFLKSGLAVAALNYRLYPAVTYPQPNEDIACAISYLQTHARDYDLTSENWTIFGDSAGAQLGAYAMSDPAISQPFAIFVGFYGPYDIAAQIARKPSSDLAAWRYVNKGRDAGTASPLLRPMKPDAKYLLFHGAKDRIVPISQSENFFKKLQSEGIGASFTRVQNAGHYFSPRTRPTSKDIKQIIINTIRQAPAVR